MNIPATKGLLSFSMRCYIIEVLVCAGAFGFNIILGVMAFFLCGTFVSNGLEILMNFFFSPFTEILQKVIWRVKNIGSLETIRYFFKRIK